MASATRVQRCDHFRCNHLVILVTATKSALKFFGALTYGSFPLVFLKNVQKTQVEHTSLRVLKVSAPKKTCP